MECRKTDGLRAEPLSLLLFEDEEMGELGSSSERAVETHGPSGSPVLWTQLMVSLCAAQILFLSVQTTPFLVTFFYFPFYLHPKLASNPDPSSSPQHWHPASSHALPHISCANKRLCFYSHGSLPDLRKGSRLNSSAEQGYGISKLASTVGWRIPSTPSVISSPG